MLEDEKELISEICTPIASSRNIQLMVIGLK